MATTAIAMRTKDQSNTTGTTTINYVNPNATSEQLQSLASAMNALTTNQILDVTRIDKQILGSEIEKLPRNMSISDADAEVKFTGTYNISAAALKALGKAAYSYGITAAGATFNEVAVNYNLDSTGDDIDGMIFAGIYDAGAGIELGFFADGETVPTGTITISLPETDQYAAESITITVVA